MHYGSSSTVLKRPAVLRLPCRHRKRGWGVWAVHCAGARRAQRARRHGEQCECSPCSVSAGRVSQSIRLAAWSCCWHSCLLPLLRAPAAHHSHRPTLPSLMNNSRQVLQLSDPGFKFGTRQQALRDKPWKDWQGATFQPVRRGRLGCVRSAHLCNGLAARRAYCTGLAYHMPKQPDCGQLNAMHDLTCMSLRSTWIHRAHARAPPPTPTGQALLA